MKKYTLSFIIFIAIVVGSVHAIQQAHDARFHNTTAIEDFKYLPSGAFMKGAALSFDEIFADLLWIKAIGYFGEHSHIDQDFKWLSRILDVATSLDPFFQDPYEFGGIILGYELNDLEGSLDILKKGMENVPKHHKRYWYLPFFTAFNYMYYKGDYQTAAHYLEIAASFPQSPSYLPLLVSRLYANTEDPGVAIPFLEKMMERASTPEMKEQLELRIKEIQVKQHLLLLTTARDRFREATGNYPQLLDELVSHGLINKIPIEPFGGSYFISKDDNSVQTSSDADDMGLHINKGPGIQLILKEKQ